jgi:hypothetical protein
MKVFTGSLNELPERKIDERNGLGFDENVLHLPEDGPGVKVAQAGIPYSKEYHDAVLKGIAKPKPKPSENKGGNPAQENK